MYRDVIPDRFEHHRDLENAKFMKSSAANVSVFTTMIRIVTLSCITLCLHFGGLNPEIQSVILDICPAGLLVAVTVFAGRAGDSIMTLIFICLILLAINLLPSYYHRLKTILCGVSTNRISDMNLELNKWRTRKQKNRDCDDIDDDQSPSSEDSVYSTDVESADASSPTAKNSDCDDAPPVTVEAPIARGVSRNDSEIPSSSASSNYSSDSNVDQDVDSNDGRDDHVVSQYRRPSAVAVSKKLLDEASNAASLRKASILPHRPIIKRNWNLALKVVGLGEIANCPLHLHRPLPLVPLTTVMLTRTLDCCTLTHARRGFHHSQRRMLYIEPRHGDLMKRLVLKNYI
jgi:hypothetical protein